MATRYGKNGQETVPIRELVLDPMLYPRKKLSTFQVSHLMQALRSGKTLPPVIACRNLKKVADGFHRIQAYKNLGGEDDEIPVEWRDYEDERALFLDAMRLNSAHGEPLTAYDRTRAMLIARKLGIADGETAASLSITVERLADLAVTRTAYANQQVVAIKRTSAPVVAQRIMSPRQQAADNAAGGMSVGFYVRQLLNAIQGDLLDTKNHRLLQNLSFLRHVLFQLDLPDWDDPEEETLTLPDLANS